MTTVQDILRKTPLDAVVTAPARVLLGAAGATALFTALVALCIHTNVLARPTANLLATGLFIVYGACFIATTAWGFDH